MTPLGRVAEFLELPAHPVLVLRGERERLVPLVPDRLVSVDLAAGRMTLDWHRTTDGAGSVKIVVVTLFPELVEHALGFGVLGRAIERGVLAVGTEDPRQFATDVHRTVDDRPYGGGPGMVMKAEPLRLAMLEAAAVGCRRRGACTWRRRARR